MGGVCLFLLFGFPRIILLSQQLICVGPFKRAVGGRGWTEVQCQAAETAGLVREECWLSHFSTVLKGEEVVKALFHLRFLRRWEWFWDWVGLWFYICKYTHYKYLFFKSHFFTFTFKESVWIAVWFWIDIFPFFFISCNITLVVSAQWHLGMLQNGHKLAHSLSHTGVIQMFFFYFKRDCSVCYWIISGSLLGEVLL